MPRRSLSSAAAAALLAATLPALPALPALAADAASADAPARAAPAPYQPPSASSEEIPQPAGPSQPGYVINTAQGDSLLVGGYVHGDARTFVGRGADAYVNQFLLRQIRPVLEGTIRNHFDYRLLPDFAGGKVVVQEAFADVRYAPWLKVRLGKMKAPVGLERLQNSNAVTFAERAFPTALAPNRDVGAQLFGDVGGVLSYAVGVFNGVVDNGIGESDQDSNKEGAARLFLTPFARGPVEALRGLGFGAAGTWGAPRGTADAPQVPTFASPGQNTILAYAAGSTAGAADPAKTVVAAGDHTRWNLQGYWYWGPLGIQSEYIESRQRLQRGSTAIHASNAAFEATASIVLTGERATYRMIVPDRPFEPAQGRWGALELAGRYQTIHFDDAIFANGFADPAQRVRGAHSWGAGVNWYLDRSFRAMLDYDRTRFFAGASSGGRVADRAPEQAIIGRAQLVF